MQTIHNQRPLTARPAQSESECNQLALVKQRARIKYGMPPSIKSANILSISHQPQRINAFFR